MSRRLWMAEAEGFDPEAMQWLRDAGFEVDTTRVEQSALTDVFQRCDVFWFRLAYQIDAQALGETPRCKVIVDPVTGLTHIDEVACESRGVEILSLRGEAEFLKAVRATAEHAFGLILSLARHTVDAHHHALREPWDRDRFSGSELFQKTLLVVGYGRLGRIVADYARAFGMRVMAYDPYILPEDVAGDVELVAPLQEAVSEADVISIHASVTASSRGLFGKEVLSCVKPGALLVNTARGVILDEDAVVKALESGRLAGVAVDVLNNEDAPQESRLVQAARAGARVLVTPHIGGHTPESFEKTERFMARKLIAYMESKTG